MQTRSLSEGYMLRVLALLLMVGCAAGQTLSPDVRTFVKVDAPVVALTHVRVIDGTGAAPIEDQTIVLRKGKSNLWAQLPRPKSPVTRRCSICTTTA